MLVLLLSAQKPSTDVTPVSQISHTMFSMSENMSQNFETVINIVEAIIMTRSVKHIMLIVFHEHIRPKVVLVIRFCNSEMRYQIIKLCILVTLGIAKVYFTPTPK